MSPAGGPEGSSRCSHRPFARRGPPGLRRSPFCGRGLLIVRGPGRCPRGCLHWAGLKPADRVLQSARNTDRELPCCSAWGICRAERTKVQAALTMVLWDAPVARNTSCRSPLRRGAGRGFLTARLSHYPDAPTRIYKRSSMVQKCHNAMVCLPGVNF